MTPSTRPLLLAAGRAVFYGAAALVDPNRLSGWRKHAYWLGLAAAVAVETALVPADDDVDPLGTPVAKAGVAVGLGGLTYGAQDLWARADAATMRWLGTLGASRPRWWYAAASAATGVAMTLLESRTPRFDEEDLFVDDRERVPMSDAVRDVVLALLGAVQGYGADELTAQLPDTVMMVDGGAIEFEVPDHAPRTVLRDYNFPVVGTFTRDGVEHMVQLSVADGHLQGLWVYTLLEDPDGLEGRDLSLPDAGLLRIRPEHEVLAAQA